MKENNDHQSVTRKGWLGRVFRENTIHTEARHLLSSITSSEILEYEVIPFLRVIIKKHKIQPYKELEHQHPEKFYPKEEDHQ